MTGSVFSDNGGEPFQVHMLSFEGPDDYSRAGGLATRVSGLSEAFAEAGFEIHLWYVGAPDLPTAKQYAWNELIRRNVAPRLELANGKEFSLTPEPLPERPGPKHAGCVDLALRPVRQRG